GGLPVDRVVFLQIFNSVVTDLLVEELPDVNQLAVWHEDAKAFMPFDGFNGITLSRGNFKGRPCGEFSEQIHQLLQRRRWTGEGVMAVAKIKSPRHKPGALVQVRMQLTG